ncbi:MAG: helix-turn-helix transcriptional regulator [Betaproteobacteria bacterium]|nr:helix-turn-helix transcriptional regulator [Betaproteobacteria bacterium]
MSFFEGRFGRLVLTTVWPGEAIEAQSSPTIVLRAGGGDVRFLNPGETFSYAELSRLIVFHADRDWLEQSLPAAFRPPERPFQVAREPITPRILRLAEALAGEALNDRFMSGERLEFMLQELVLSIVESYLTPRRATSPWLGSRFEDSRIRRAISLLRARPVKDQSMDQLASQVGLSRSRFYDLFQVCTGFSPRTYLDLLCIEAAISRLASGRGRIRELSAELGFSAQSNFTRFFQQQVGVPPSQYRRAAAAPPRLPAAAE